MDLDAMRAATRRRAGVSSSDQLAADADLLEIIQEALDLFNNVRLWPWAETSASLALVAGTASYAMPTGWVATKSVHVQGRGPLDGRMSRGDLDASWPTATNTGVPQYYVVAEDGLRVYPTPSEAATVTHVYFRQETRLSAGSDTPLAPVWTHAAIVDKATALLLARMREHERSAAFDARFADWARQTSDNVRRSTAPRSVRVRSGGFV